MIRREQFLPHKLRHGKSHFTNLHKQTKTNLAPVNCGHPQPRFGSAVEARSRVRACYGQRASSPIVGTPRACAPALPSIYLLLNGLGFSPGGAGGGGVIVLRVCALTRAPRASLPECAASRRRQLALRPRTRAARNVGAAGVASAAGPASRDSRMRAQSARAFPARRASRDGPFPGARAEGRSARRAAGRRAARNRRAARPLPMPGRDRSGHRHRHRHCVPLLLDKGRGAQQGRQHLE